MIGFGQKKNSISSEEYFNARRYVFLNTHKYIVFKELNIDMPKGKDNFLFSEYERMSKKSLKNILKGIILFFLMEGADIRMLFLKI